MKEVFMALPWWARWIAIPAVLLVVFGSMLASLIGFILSLIFKILLAAAAIALLIFLVRKFTGSSKTSGSSW
jgi:hypothetical protein